MTAAGSSSAGRHTSSVVCGTVYGALLQPTVIGKAAELSGFAVLVSVLALERSSA